MVAPIPIRVVIRSSEVGHFAFAKPRKREMRWTRICPCEPISLSDGGNRVSAPMRFPPLALTRCHRQVMCGFCDQIAFASALNEIEIDVNALAPKADP